MIFTSGSTGVPKGVVVPTRAVFHLVNRLQELYGFRPEDRFSKAYNLSFDGSVHDMFTSWNAGASLHPVPANQLMAPMKFIQESRLTVWTSVPSTAVFLDRLKMLPPGAFPSLRYSIFSGEPLPLRSALAWKRAAPNSMVDNILGHTECWFFSTLERLSDPPNVTPNRGLVAVGKPLPGFEAAVFDEACTPLPPGKEGELALSGPQVAQGYFQDPDRTAARSPLIDGKIWYRTGDLVYRGRLRYLSPSRPHRPPGQDAGPSRRVGRGGVAPAPRSAARIRWLRWPGRWIMVPLGGSRISLRRRALRRRRSATKWCTGSRVTSCRRKCSGSHAFRSPPTARWIARR